MIIIYEPYIFDYDNISTFDFLMNNYIKKIYCKKEMKSIFKDFSLFAEDNISCSEGAYRLLLWNRQLFAHNIIDCLAKNYTQYLNILINDTSISRYIKSDSSCCNSNIQNFIMNNLFIEPNDNSDSKLIKILDYNRIYNDHFSMARCMYDRFAHHQKMIIISYYCNLQDKNDAIINTITQFEPTTEKIHDNFFYQMTRNDIVKMINESVVFDFDLKTFENLIVYYIYVRHLVCADDIFEKFLNLYPYYPDIVIANKKVIQFKIIDCNIKSARFGIRQ